MLSRVSDPVRYNLCDTTWAIQLGRYTRRHTGRHHSSRQRGDEHQVLRGNRRLRGRRSLRSLEPDWSRSPQVLKPPLARQAQ